MSAELAPGSALEVAAILRGGAFPRLRLCGSGSRAARTPSPPSAALPLSLRRLDRIDRLAADDLTCSVQPGVTRAALDAALRPHGLELGCAGGGTLGGLFASDPIGAVVPGGAAPRTLLLGVEAVLADGTCFRAGARVVKSVAGFDVHKLLCGSHGRLFAATLLHLKLRPQPRACVRFARTGLDRGAALSAVAALRQLPCGLHRLWLRRDDAGFAYGGSFGGRPAFLRGLLQAHGLADDGTEAPDHLAAGDGTEVVAGNVRWSRLPGLLAALPTAAPFLLHGGGRFEAVLPPAAADALLAALPALGADGCIVAGAPERRGRGTPLEPGAARLQQQLLAAFDPAAVFA